MNEYIDHDSHSQSLSLGGLFEVDVAREAFHVAIGNEPDPITEEGRMYTDIHLRLDGVLQMNLKTEHPIPCTFDGIAAQKVRDILQEAMRNGDFLLSHAARCMLDDIDQTKRAS